MRRFNKFCKEKCLNRVLRMTTHQILLTLLLEFDSRFWSGRADIRTGASHQDYLCLAKAAGQTDRYLQMLAKLGRTDLPIFS